MGEHLNTKRDTSKHHKRGFSESQDILIQRRQRVSFKNYLQELEEELLEEELEILDEEFSERED